MRPIPQDPDAAPFPPSAVPLRFQKRWKNKAHAEVLNAGSLGPEAKEDPARSFRAPVSMNRWRSENKINLWFFPSISNSMGKWADGKIHPLVIVDVGGAEVMKIR